MFRLIALALTSTFLLLAFFGTSSEQAPAGHPMRVMGVMGTLGPKAEGAEPVVPGNRYVSRHHQPLKAAPDPAAHVLHILPYGARVELIGAGEGSFVLVRDPAVFDMARAWAGAYGDRLRLVQGTFSDLDELAGEPVDGVVLDLGVSSMQLDQPERGFSFLRDGPLDMRMGQEGPSAADLLNTAEESRVADVLYHYGEERAARRIARAIVAARPLATTAQLAEVVQSCLPRPKPGQSHPATRSFQAIRIWVNDEFGQLLSGLMAAERALKPGGRLAVVSFHSLEDRVVKRFMQARANAAGGGSRYAPELRHEAAAFTLPFRRAIGADDEELAANPRARSAFLRVAVRTDAPAGRPDPAALGLPQLPGGM